METVQTVEEDENESRGRQVMPSVQTILHDANTDSFAIYIIWTEEKWCNRE